MRPPCAPRENAGLGGPTKERDGCWGPCQGILPLLVPTSAKKEVRGEHYGFLLPRLIPKEKHELIAALQLQEAGCERYCFPCGFVPFCSNVESAKLFPPVRSGRGEGGVQRQLQAVSVVKGCTTCCPGAEAGIPFGVRALRGGWRLRTPASALG
ncbi:hypothetical protein NDU88_004304 [Pleurodeles waltl]|uniref:Uncharacterized protein n=1 Tax=Pleurodeles waltl TaxID=8319 RepID=A0AAV7UGG8_PLEWA|nr:hypothetical protein NDU88_004304 [Pleurodeles waltl]